MALALGSLLAVAAFVLAGRSQPESADGQHVYTNDPRRRPELTVRLDDLRVHDRTVRYSLQPIDIQATASEAGCVDPSGGGVLVIADTEHQHASSYLDSSEYVYFLPVDNLSRGSAVAHASGTTLVGDQGTTTDLSLPIRHIRPYWYPLDEIEISITTELIFLCDDRGNLGTVAYTLQAAELSFPGWVADDVSFDVREHVEPYSYAYIRRTSDPGNMFAHLSRPAARRLSTVVLVLCLSAFTVSLWFVELAGTLWEVAAAQLLGLWGLRSILVGPEVSWPIALDNVFLGLYATTFAVLVLAVVQKAVRKKEGGAEAQNAVSHPQPEHRHDAHVRHPNWALVILGMGLLAAVVCRAVLDRTRQDRQ